MHQNLADALLALSRAYPDRLAIDAPEYTLTYRELMERAHKLASLLRQEGIGLGDRVGVALTSNAEALVAVIALWFLGATAMVSDFRSRAAERQKLTERLGLKFYLVDRAAPGSESYPAVQIKPGWESTLASDAGNEIKAAVIGNRIAIIGVSSGTSGLPQPVALSHDCLFARYCMARTSPEWKAGGRFIVSAPLAFSATRKHVLARLLDGGTVIFTPLLMSARDLASRILTSRATAMLTVPAVLRGLLEMATPGKVLFPELGYLMCCGAPMLPHEKIDTLERLTPGFVQNYGSTMAGMITVLASQDVKRHVGSVGRPLDHVVIEIVDGQGQPVAAGETGIIRVRTPGIAEALPGADEARQSDLVIDGWIYPGDIGSLNAEGFLTIVGRSTDVIIRGGVNVYPSEVEEVLGQHPGVSESAVVGAPDAVLGEEIAAFVVLKGTASVQELLAHCRNRLHPDKQPRQILIVDSLPRNANGKLVRRNLLDLLPTEQVN